jgi:hypothetical protein
MPMVWLVQATSVTAPGHAGIAEPELQLRTSPDQGDPANDWLCAWCHNHVASEKDRFFYDGQSEFSFKNPEGSLFQIVMFTRTIGCRERGVPTLDHTWFPGHAWCNCVCDRCRMQLGWCYSGPSAFAGLIRDRIVRALLVRN